MKQILLMSVGMLFYIHSNAQTKLIITYDPSGNQMQREYCNGCASRTQVAETQKEKVPAEETLDSEIQNNTDEITIFPNPTDGQVLLQWKEDFGARISHIKIVGYHSPFEKKLSYTNSVQSLTVDLSREPSSMYIVQFYLLDGSLITKKIIKK